jgi:PPM family protein phosphatase
MMARTKLGCAGDSHPGMVRQNNEDRVHCDADRGIFLVVDGIGGQAAGEKAADIAVSLVRGRLERQTGATEDRIREAITVANNEILREARAHPENQGMACVLTVAVIDNGSATIGHVGDSRLYKIRRGEIQKITHDHSPVGEREDSRQISEAEAMRHPRRNEVYRDVGSEEHTPDDPDFIELQRIRFEPDSALLLCSDGLSDQVTSAEILHTVQANAGHPYSAVHELIDAANRAGGKDNVSVVIVEGEQFSLAAQRAAGAVSRPPTLVAARPAIFVYGLLCGVALLWLGLRQFGLLNLTAAPVKRPAQTLTISPGGTIAEVLQKAQPGDIVEVPSGEYREQIRLKDGVTLRGRLTDVPVLRADPDAAGPAIVADGVHGAHVTGFRILADKKTPLAVGVQIADSDLELQDTTIKGAATGIVIGGHSAPVLRADTIEDCLETAIRISGDSAPQLRHNTILRNAHGVVVEAPARPALDGNTFGDNGGEQLTLPPGMDRDTIMKLNLFLPAQPRARGRRGAAH